MNEIKLPGNEITEMMFSIVKCLTNNTKLTIVNHLIEYGASNIADIAARVDVNIVYRTIQTAQNEMLKQGMIEYRESFTDSRKVIYFTDRFLEAIRFLNEFENYINQFNNNQTPHDVNSKAFGLFRVRKTTKTRK